MSEAPDALPVRRLRTFHPRQRRLSDSRQARFEAAFPPFRVDAEGEPLAFDTLFARPAPKVVLDIGIGGGEGTVAMARSRPDECLLAVEVHTPGVANVVLSAVEEGWTHVRVCQGDVLDLLPRIAPGSLDGIRVWFPDPWPKAKQRKRRLVRPDVVAAFAERLRPGGVLHLATDHADYAEQMREVCTAEPSLDGGEIPRPSWRPVTRFEQRGRHEGRPPVDLWYVRR
jgi:tRNA (guanine-N7-)-methyltransferase